jgi:SpoVK/Ycf46/Vps4 family AAA+-type ATPase
MADLYREIDLLVRANYPIVYIVTWEEERAIEDVRRVALERIRDLYTWSVSERALMDPAGRKKDVDPLEALNEFLKSEDELIYVLYDFHPFLTESQQEIVRKLRDIVLALKTGKDKTRRERKTIVIISPVLRIPAELEKDITVIDYPLPDLAELGAVLDRVLKPFKDDPSFRITLDGVSREKVLKAALGLTLSEAERVVLKALEDHKRFSEKEVNIILDEKKQTIRKSGILEYISTQEAFDDIGGLGELKEWLRKRSDAFTEEARDFGLPEPKGVMLIGVPGCGKSMCAKAIAAEWDKPLLRLEIGSLFGAYVGSSEANIRKAIAIAESVSPAILWIDEIEKGFSGTHEGDSGTTGRVFGAFVTWMQEKTKPVFVVATANDISKLPAELLRKGRFDEIFFVDLPGEQERENIFDIHMRKRIGAKRLEEQLSKGLSLSELATQTADFSGAEIEQVVIAALYDAFSLRAEEPQLRIAPYLLRNIKNTVPLAVTMTATVGGLRRWAATRARPASSHIQNSIPDWRPPRQPWLQKMRIPYAFDDNQIAQTLEEFRSTGEAHKDEIARDLYNERIESWFRANGFESVARETRKIREEASNRDFGVEEFFSALGKFVERVSS